MISLKKESINQNKIKTIKQYINMKNKILLSALFLALLCGLTFSQDEISSKDAKNFIGETKTVKGVVASVFVSKSGTILINFDEVHPNATFVAVIKKDSGITYDNIVKGSILTVSGKIEDYKGKPEIIINEQSQIVKVE
jgi:DNA/RNA endonuclease YhcR with UshA esterase domain